MKNKIAYFSLVNATIVTLFLFYIDEGYYNFNWMTSVGNWFVFFIYLTFLTVLLLVLNLILQIKLNIYVIAVINLVILPITLICLLT
jgi:hypothetical protein